MSAQNPLDKNSSNSIILKPQKFFFNTAQYMLTFLDAESLDNFSNTCKKTKELSCLALAKAQAEKMINLILNPSD